MSYMSHMGGQGFFSSSSKNHIYSYTRSTQESQVLTSAPGKITAGGDMEITAATLTNDNSHILAGGNLIGTFGSVENTATAGERIVRY